MRTLVQKFFIVVGVLLMLIGVFGLSYTWHMDHRSAETLSEYAANEFNISRDGEGYVEGAVLTLWDYRFDDAQLLKKAILITDGNAWEIEAATRRTPPPESGSRFRAENKLFVEFPKASLKSILNAEAIRFKFFYDNGQAIDLPLSSKDLALWKRKIRW